MDKYEQRGYLIEFGTQFSGMHPEGGNGAVEYVHWLLRQSVKDMVDNPIRMITQFKKTEYIPDLFKHNDMHLVSQKFRDLVEPHLKDYEFLPMTVELTSSRSCKYSGGGAVIPGYYWLNCWRRLDIIDEERSNIRLSVGHIEGTPESIFDTAPIKYSSWIDLRFKTPPAENEHLYGLHEMFGVELYISDFLHKLICDAKLKVVFYPKLLKVGYYHGVRKVIADLNPNGTVTEWEVEQKGWKPRQVWVESEPDAQA
jgi:hypothetical protein